MDLIPAEVYFSMWFLFSLYSLIIPLGSSTGSAPFSLLYFIWPRLWKSHKWLAAVGLAYTRQGELGSHRIATKCLLDESTGKNLTTGTFPFCKGQ